MPGIIGKKIGMTSLFTADGLNVPATLIEAGPCFVTQVKTVEKDGYAAVQIGFGKRKARRTTKPMAGHFAKAGVEPLQKLTEFRPDNAQDVLAYKAGQQLGADFFVEGDFVNVVGTSKGKGFQGVVKRHNFQGVGGQTHGQHNRLRHPGSIGACSWPSRVFKGMRMGGRMGNDRVKVQNLKVMRVVGDKNLILVSGSIPGAKNSYVVIEK